MTDLIVNGKSLSELFESVAPQNRETIYVAALGMSLVEKDVTAQMKVVAAMTSNRLDTGMTVEQMVASGVVPYRSVASVRQAIRKARQEFPDDPLYWPLMDEDGNPLTRKVEGKAGKPAEVYSVTLFEQLVYQKKKKKKYANAQKRVRMALLHLLSTAQDMGDQACVTLCRTLTDTGFLAQDRERFLQWVLTTQSSVISETQLSVTSDTDLRRLAEVRLTNLREAKRLAAIRLANLTQAKVMLRASEAAVGEATERLTDMGNQLTSIYMMLEANPLDAFTPVSDTDEALDTLRLIYAGIEQLRDEILQLTAKLRGKKAVQSAKASETRRYNRVATEGIILASPLL